MLHSCMHSPVALHSIANLHQRPLVHVHILIGMTWPAIYQVGRHKQCCTQHSRDSRQL